MKVGSFGTIGTTATTHSSGKDFVFNSSLQYFRQNGWNFNATDQNNVNKTQVYDQNNFGFSLSSSYKNLSIRTLYGSSDLGVMGDLPIWNANGTFNSVNAYRGLFDIGHTLNYNRSQYATVNFTFNSFKQKSNRDGSPADYHSNDGLLEYTHFFRPSDKLNVVAGALTTYITGEATSTDLATSLPYFPVSEYDEWRWAAYVQADYLLLPQLKVIGGGQLNKVPGNDWDFVPRLGAIYNITSELGIKALYGQAFKSAAANEKFSNVTNTLYGNQTLAPEKVTTYDLQFFFQRPSYQFTASAFRSEIENIVVRKRFEQLP